MRQLLAASLLFASTALPATLIDAAAAGDLPKLRQMIAQKADVNAADRYGITPLVAACTSATGPATATLLAAGADANKPAPGGETPLMLAARAGNLDAVRALLAAKANVNTADPKRQQTALHWAAAANQPAIVKLLLAAGANANARDKVDTTRTDLPLFNGAVGAPPRIPLGGSTAILLAARQGDRESAEALLKAGANINDTVTSDGSSPLMLAILNTHYDLAAWLLEHGADPNQPDLTGMTPLFATADMRRPDIIARPFRKETDQTTSLDLMRLLLAKKADPSLGLKRSENGMAPGSTPFLRAAKSADAEAMRLLMDRGANPLMPSADQNTALILAAGGGGAAQFGNVQINEPDSLQAVKLALDLGLDPNAVNARGQTALHAATARGWNSVIRLLVDKGARLDIKDKAGLTPLTSAEARTVVTGTIERHDDTIALLRELAARH